MMTPHRKVSAASNNATNLKASTGYLLKMVGHNVNAAVRYVKFYNKATAPSPGTDTPVLVVPLPAAGAPVNIDFPDEGMEFSLGIGYGIVTGGADSDNTSTAANEQFFTLWYR